MANKNRITHCNGSNCNEYATPEKRITMKKLVDVGMGKTFAQLMESKEAPAVAKEYEPTYRDVDSAPATLVAVRATGDVYAKLAVRIKDDLPFIVLRTYKGRVQQSQKFGGFYAVPLEQFGTFVLRLSEQEVAVEKFLKSAK